MSDDDVKKVWAEFWEPLIAGDAEPTEAIWREGDPAGPVHMTRAAFDQIRRELFDFHSAMQVVPSVYDHATGGQLSKITYDSVPQITRAIDEHYTEIAHDEFLDALLNVTEQWGDNPVLESFVQDLLEAMEISLDEFTDYAKQRRSIAALREKAQAGDSSTAVDESVDD